MSASLSIDRSANAIGANHSIEILSIMWWQQCFQYQNYLATFATPIFLLRGMCHVLFPLSLLSLDLHLHLGFDR